MRIDFKEEIVLPEKVEAKYELGILTVKGPKGEVKKKLLNKKIKILAEKSKIVLEALQGTKREKRQLYAFHSHAKNMIQGVSEGHFCELKICSGHFPMTVTVAGQDLTVKNFLGENFPRKLKLKPGVKVVVEGDKVKVEGPDKELVGQTAADIETLTWVRGRDRRIFQDGVFIINKDGKLIK